MSTAGSKYCVLLVLVVCLVNGVVPFNFDPLSPTVVFPERLGRDNEELFGFSLAQHRYTNGDTSLLVGAPRAVYDNSIEGGVYECFVQNGSQCSRRDVFNFRNDSIINNFRGIRQATADFFNQFMGFTVHSSNGYITACAPFFTSSRETNGEYTLYSTDGRCVVLPQDFNSTAPFQITSLLTPNANLLGFDAHFYKPSVNGKLQLALGSVLAGTGLSRSGAVYSVGFSTTLATSEANTVSSSPLFDEYRGYHLESGHFAVDISSGVTELIASAPKANRHYGQIMSLTINGNTLREMWVEVGLEPDAYFGHDFALLNLGTNGYHSIVVGCPSCNRDRGRVILYLHSGNPSNPLRERIIIDSPSPQKGYFGYSVELLGDIDRDGYDDVAISAPYINERGVVYIYRGSRDGLIHRQTISSPNEMSGFGLVMSGGIDVDDNGYPDLSIGDLSGSQVVTVRTSPIVNVTELQLITTSRINYAERNCLVNGLELTCFNVTPCFNLTSVYGPVPTIAIKYTLVVDRLAKRVRLVEQLQTNEITVEMTLPVGEQSCGSALTYVLQPDFSSTDPFPVELTVTNIDSPLPLVSPDDSTFGGPLHPVLNDREYNIQQMIIPEFINNCGSDQICNPVYRIDVNLEGTRRVIPLAAAYQFSITVTLNITEEDSLAATLAITMPPGMQFANSRSITALAISQCESLAAQMIRCSLKNPIAAGEVVILQLSFRPNVREIDLSQRTLLFNFTVQDANHTDIPLAETALSVSTFSEASYEIRSSVIDAVQAFRVPFTNLSLGNVGPNITYQVSISNTQLNNRSSPIPNTLLTITWPSAITLPGQQQSPYLVPSNLVIRGSNSTICRQKNAIPSELMSTGLQFAPNITESVAVERCPGNNISCGVIQCNISHIQAQPATPVQISLFATLWSPSIRSEFNVSLYAKVESLTEYPQILNESITEATSYIVVQPAVQEVMVDCLQPWIIMVAVIAGLLAVLVIILCLAIFGFVGVGRFKRMKEKELRKQWRELQEVDSSLGTRVIPPPGTFVYQKTKKEVEDKDREAKEDEAAADEIGAGPPRYSTVVLTEDDELGPITGLELNLEDFSAPLGNDGDEMETEI